MKFRHIFGLIALGSLFLFSCNESKPAFELSGEAVAQENISRIDMMPAAPEPYKMKDWLETAIGFDQLVYDFEAEGDYRPFIWLDPNKRNFDQTTFGLFTAIGDVRQGANKNGGEGHEALGVLGSLLGASLIGIDKTNQNGMNFVKMAQNYFNKDNGWNIILNFTNKSGHIGGGYQNDWWYDIYNNVLYYALCNQYPKVDGTEEIMRSIANQFYAADSILGDNYSYSYFDFGKMVPGTNHIVPQEDAAAGMALVLYQAYIKFGDQKYLKAAVHALTVLQNQPENRYYEILMPFGAYLAARLNAEEGQSMDVKKFIEWSFDGKATNRVGWGVIAERWGTYDVHGLVGSTVHNGGYAFLMNTFDQSWPLTSMLRYDQRYATAIGKWVLNAANASRLFYPDEIPDSLQALPELKEVTGGVIAYEGLIKESTFDQYKGISPFAQGDGPNWAPGMPPETMFSVYGSSHVGIFGSIIRTTNVEKILQINCDVTDFYQKTKGYPTYLYYNPYTESKTVEMECGAASVDIYDSVSRTFIATGKKGKVQVELPASASRVLVCIPSGAKYAVEQSKLLANGVPVDYRYGIGQ